MGQQSNHYEKKNKSQLLDSQEFGNTHTQIQNNDHEQQSVLL